MSSRASYMLPKAPKHGRMRARNKPEPGHLDWVRSRRCLCCNRPAEVAHHLLRCSSRRGQYRAADKHTIPLCDRHHRALHEEGNERRFLLRFGLLEPEAYAEALYLQSSRERA